MRSLRWTFPPAPTSFRGRRSELATLARLIERQHPTVVALIGAGGSGKTTLAAALGHRLNKRFAGRVAWLRIGAWDVATIAKMMAMQLGLPTAQHSLKGLARALAGAGRSLIVLDNHEKDRTTAAVLDALRDAPATWVITARRCLLGGVTIFPVVAPLVSRQESPFPAIAGLTRLLRWHPVALDVADALVTSRAIGVTELERRLRARGVGRIEAVEHEDDIPEVRGVVAEAIRKLGRASRRMLVVLAHQGGDHMDPRSLAQLAGVRSAPDAALKALQRFRLVQRPAPERFTLHATVRHAVTATSTFDPDRIARHYLALLERSPERLELEQTHLFALMDWAQERRDLSTILRVQELAERLDAGRD